jgi:prepilin-type N-terminal cleavage/methylation domain-containing protein
MNGERGYSLVELMVALVITALIAVVLGLVVQQIATVPEKSNDQVEALHTVQNFIHWVGLDAEAAESALGGNSLNLTLPNDSVISYGKMGNTVYRYSGSGNQTIANNVTSMNFTISDRIIIMSIVAAPESRWDISENKTYQVAMRPSGI